MMLEREHFEDNIKMDVICTAIDMEGRGVVQKKERWICTTQEQIDLICTTVTVYVEGGDNVVSSEMDVVTEENEKEGEEDVWDYLTYWTFGISKSQKFKKDV